jgi:hypothetical protein
MRINVSDLPTFSQPVVGNVYALSGGYGRKAGHSMVLIAITEKQAALMLVIDKDGTPVGVTAYGVHAIADRAPIAFVPGLDTLEFNMEPLP